MFSGSIRGLLQRCSCFSSKLTFRPFFEAFINRCDDLSNVQYHVYQRLRIRPYFSIRKGNMISHVFRRMFFITCQPLNVTCKTYVTRYLPRLFTCVQDGKDRGSSGLIRSFLLTTLRSRRLICAGRGNASAYIMERLLSISYRFLGRFVRKFRFFLNNEFVHCRVVIITIMRR